MLALLKIEKDNKEKSQLVVYSLIDFKIVSVFNVPFKARKIALHPNLSQVYFPCIFDQKQKKDIDLISIDIGFRKNTILPGHLNLRD